jgi:RNA polymerase sigma-70 factor (ECF subfamily)
VSGPPNWNSDVFEAAYRDLAPRANAIATRVLRDGSAAEDVVQEVFIDLWRRPHAFDSTRGTLSAYVSMLARCRALDRLRALAAHDAAAERSARESAVAAAAPESAADPILRRERRDELVEVLGGIPRSQREAVFLSCGLGLTNRELAHVSRIPLGTAKSRLRLGLRRARAALEAAA